MYYTQSKIIITKGFRQDLIFESEIQFSKAAVSLSDVHLKENGSHKLSKVK